MTYSWKHLGRGEGKRPDGVRDGDIVRWETDGVNGIYTAPASCVTWDTDCEYELRIDQPTAEPGDVHEAKIASNTDVLRDIANERQRQIDVERWSPEHDDEHRQSHELSRAAATYALAGLGANGPFWVNHLQVPQQVWPYRWEWKPKDRRSNLVRAGALIVAEIERLDRSALAEAEPASIGETK